jgi:hypothetical protein
MNQSLINYLDEDGGRLAKWAQHKSHQVSLLAYVRLYP